MALPWTRERANLATLDDDVVSRDRDGVRGDQVSAALERRRVRRGSRTHAVVPRGRAALRTADETTVRPSRRKRVEPVNANAEPPPTPPPTDDHAFAAWAATVAGELLTEVRAQGLQGEGSRTPATWPPTTC